MTAIRIFGLHAAQALLDYSPERIVRVWVDAQRRDQRLSSISEALAAQHIQAQMTDRKTLQRLASGQNHQGIVIEAHMPQALDEQALKKAVAALQKTALFLVLDHVQDPHNLGACLRSADATAVDGLILPKDQAVGITPVVCKVASGAAESVPVYQVTNLARTLRWLKGQNIWIVGAAGEADDTLYQVDMTVPLALVVGAEGKGMRRLIRESCDLLVRLPMQGEVQSLNVSVAAGVLLYEAVRQRL